MEFLSYLFLLTLTGVAAYVLSSLTYALFRRK